MLLVVPAIAIVANLRSSYRSQKNFNELRNRIHQLNEGQRRAGR
jgi:hypothetical protein